MNRLRWLILILGPAPIVLGSVGLSQWMKSERQPVTSNQAIVRGQGPAVSPRAGAPTLVIAQAVPSKSKLESLCQQAGRQLAQQLGSSCQVIVRTPFVIAGDCSQEMLQRWYDQTIGPAARSLANCYFTAPADQPISVLLFANEQSYNHYARLLFGDEGISVYGYYKPGQRTLVMNISTGGGTLVHELTHALMDFDFPEVPDWFNEGLASLHEQCHIRRDESGIDGLVNWRLEGLQKAQADGKLRSLASLIESNDFRRGNEGLNYAQARYFCLYMQEQGVLRDYYRKFRANQQRDPLGYQTVGEVFSERTWDELDADFRAWFGRLKQPAR